MFTFDPSTPPQGFWDIYDNISQFSHLESYREVSRGFLEENSSWASEVIRIGDDRFTLISWFGRVCPLLGSIEHYLAIRKLIHGFQKYHTFVYGGIRSSYPLNLSIGSIFKIPAGLNT